MNFNGATSKMKANAELYLRENCTAYWAPNRKPTDEDEDVAPVEKVVPAIFTKPKKKVRSPTCLYLNFDCNFEFSR